MWFLSSLLALSFSATVLGLDDFPLTGFTQGATLSVAQQLGFFKNRNLNVVFSQITAEPAGYAGLINGTFLLLTGTSDDAIDFVYKQNASLTLTGQLDLGPDIVIAGRPEITDIRQLRGKSIIVDNPSSGFAYLIRKILQVFGLVLNTDYTFIAQGSTFVRYRELLSGSLANGTEVFGTLLTYPFTGQGEVLLASQKPNILARAENFVNPFLSEVFTIRTSSLKNATELDLLTRFHAAMLEANHYLNQTANRRCSIQAIQKTLNVTSQVAELEYVAATDPVTGETVSQGGNFTINQQGLLNVLDLRMQFDGFEDLPTSTDFVDHFTPGPGKFIDYSIRDAAVASLSTYTPRAICS